MRRSMALLFLVICLGCGKGDSGTVPAPVPTPTPTPTPTPLPSGYQVIDVQNGGSLAVKVSYQGRVPRRVPVADPGCPDVKYDDIVVNQDKLLKDAVVYLVINQGKDFSVAPAQVIDQIG